MLKIRCSQLGLLMTKAKSGGGLSETAKGMVKDIVREQLVFVKISATRPLKKAFAAKMKASNC